jgi:16S rRNA (uracil1498-N3)-methyltransferase
VEAGARLTLDPDRAHYLTRVLRLRRGESLVVFNGLGRGWAATLENAGPRSATLAVGSLLADEPPPRPRLHLIQGLLKGAAMDQVVQKATELGATDLWLVHAARSNMPREAGRLARKLEHWQRVVESAAEQCKALHLPRLHPLRDLAELLARPPAATLILLHPGAETLPLSLPREDTALLVGPEGGWSEAERQAAGAAGARVCGLGDRVLRAETAPLVALSALRHGWGWT